MLVRGVQGVLQSRGSRQISRKTVSYAGDFSCLNGKRGCSYSRLYISPPFLSNWSIVYVRTLYSDKLRGGQLIRPMNDSSLEANVAGKVSDGKRPWWDSIPLIRDVQ